MDDRIVLVTGAAGGLGAHVTRAFLETGAIVAGSSRRITGADFPSRRLAAFPADLGRASDATALADAVAARFGGIDALVHVAGGFAGGVPIHETEDAVWDGMMSLNAGAAFHILRAAIPYLRRSVRGRIVAIGSRAGVEPVAGIGAYAASKAALVSLVRTAALENRAAGVTVNVILPGTIDTEANRRADPGADRSAWVAPERIAALAVFLVSDAAAEITGAAIPVYGRGL
jgi:NAD(P)-dependent dehydrogenase (short-subunit alcohol dehydrogenase family)